MSAKQYLSSALALLLFNSSVFAQDHLDKYRLPTATETGSTPAISSMKIAATSTPEALPITIPVSSSNNVPNTLAATQTKVQQSYHPRGRSSSNPHTLRLEAWKLTKAGNNKAAIMKFKQAISINDGLWQAWHGMGQSYQNLGMNQEASIAYERTIKLLKNEQTYIQLGQSYQAMGKSNKALNAFHRARAINPNNTHVTSKVKQLNQKKIQQVSNKFSIQIGAYVNFPYARQLANSIDTSKLPSAYISKNINGMYAVRMGVFESKKEARKLLSQLEQSTKGRNYFITRIETN